MALNARCVVEPLFDIRPGSFTPAPRVDSTFVRLVPDEGMRARIADEAAFDQVVRQAFNMRRKRLANALKGLLAEHEIRDAGVDPDLRAEQLTVADYLQLTNRYAEST